MTILRGSRIIYGIKQDDKYITTVKIYFKYMFLLIIHSLFVNRKNHALFSMIILFRRFPSPQR
jgi:hypothetical protein